MAKNFEYLEEGEIKLTASEALDDAMHTLESVDPQDEAGLSIGAFIYGLEGRRVSASAAQDVLSYLGSACIISLDNGRIQHPHKI